MANKAHGDMDLLISAGDVDKKSVYYSRFFFFWQAGGRFIFLYRYPKTCSGQGRFSPAGGGERDLLGTGKIKVDRGRAFPL